MTIKIPSKITPRKTRIIIRLIEQTIGRRLRDKHYRLEIRYKSYILVFYSSEELLELYNSVRCLESINFRWNDWKMKQRVIGKFLRKIKRYFK